ncbi:MAG: sugar phosphate isomerase/epimerase family protein, partial [Thermomicrobiales bacterium]
MSLLLSYSTWGMPAVPIDVAVAHCAATGYDGLELTVIPGWTTDAATLDAPERRRIRKLYDDHHLALCGLSGNTPLLAANPEEHTQNLARFRGYLDLAAELQKPGEQLTVSTTSGGTPEDWERDKGRLVDCFGKLADHA